MKINTFCTFLIVITCTTLSLFVLGYVNQEHPAYLWDWGNYYYMYQEYGHAISSDPLAWAKKLIKSINEDDYNASSVAILTPVYLLAGENRIAYITGIYWFFIIPAALMSTALSVKASASSPSKFTKTIVFLLCLLTPPFWQSSLRGMTDIIGLIPLGGAAIIILKSNFFDSNKIRSAFWVGFLVWLSFMFRRWYAYAGFALLSCTFAVSIMKTNFRKETWQAITNRLLPYFIIVCVGCFMLLAFQLGLSKRIISTSYSDAYQAYQAPISESFRRLISRSGYFFVIFMTLGLGLALIRRNFAILFCGSVSVLTFALFTQTQAPSVQHGLPIIFFMLPAFAYPIILALSSIRQPINQLVLSLCSVLIAVVIFSASFVPSIHPLFNFTYITPNDRYPPLKVNNYHEYQKLINELIKVTSNGEKFTVFASSEALTGSLLTALDKRLESKNEWAAQVDERDGFLVNTLKSKYAVVASPTPLHLPETSQRVVSVPSEQILNGEGIGIDYKVSSGPYHLAFGHEAYIYERVHELDSKSIEKFATSLKQYHSNWRWDGFDRIGTIR
ncbi:hypothetical protein ACFQ3K_14880 [Brucella gallinifaecis]|uniref:Glycosyltransferase RgtA/B/C/D-like domain-containing protein n=1 Tax=Brucella gallinifaecis TaxID=215590 RepID=A0A502BRA4_9HYPH|nr:hypothetical protein [Brucella gallinifaecis]TPF76744.1 hypothetical protein FHY56_04435 [Brucella gallinifaecis]